MLSDRCPSVLSVSPVCPVCDVGVLWPNGWMDQDATWHGCRSRPRPQCARWGTSSPSPKGAEPPIFGPYVVAKWLDGSRCHLVGRQPSAQATLCKMGTQLPLPKRELSPQFSAHVSFNCSHTAAWIKMALGTEVGLGPGTLC